MILIPICVFMKNIKYRLLDSRHFNHNISYDINLNLSIWSLTWLINTSLLTVANKPRAISTWEFFIMSKRKLPIAINPCKHIYHTSILLEILSIIHFILALKLCSATFVYSIINSPVWKEKKKKMKRRETTL